MTTIVMVQKPEDVIAGWDSQISSNAEVSTLVQSKVWAQDGIVYGFSGSLRISDIIQTTEFPGYDGTDPRKWIISKWAPTMYERIDGDAFAFNEENGMVNDFGLLMVLGGEVFELDSALSPSQRADGLYALGSGSTFARGALLSGATVIEALEVARTCDAFTGGDLTAKSVNVILDEDFAGDGEYQIVVSRAKQPHKKWGFRVDFDKSRDKRLIMSVIGDTIGATMVTDQTYLRSKYGSGGPADNTPTDEPKGEPGWKFNPAYVPDARGPIGVGGPVWVPTGGPAGGAGGLPTSSVKGIDMNGKL